MALVQIRRIQKIRSYRAFQNWSDESRPKEFARVNLIYSANGGGKSTIASLFRTCAEPEVPTPDAGLELVVEASRSRSNVSESDADFWSRVRVFNADYVRENLRFDDEFGPSPNSLLTLGKPSVDAEKELAEVEAKLAALRPKLQPARTAASTAENQLQRRMSEVASNVVEDLRQSSVPKYKATNTYNKANVRALLNDDASVFDQASEDIATDRSTAVARAKEPVILVRRDQVGDSSAVAQIRSLLSENIAAQVIETLRGHEERAEWVQTGIPLHEGLDTCLFCEQPLTQRRKDELAAHFDDSLKILQSNIDAQIVALKKSVEDSETYQAQIPRDADLYSDLTSELRKARSEYMSKQNAYSKSADALITALKSKRNNPFQVSFLDDDTELVPPTTDELDATVKRHEEQRGSHATKAADAARSVELARVKEFATEYSERRKDTDYKAQAAKDIEEEIKSLGQRTIALQNVSEDPVPKAEELTRNVERLLGRADLKLITSSDGKHYRIDRNGISATHLSEGERTAIALLHFLASVRQNVVAGDEPIVVIDDPVSSLDESILFGASSFLWSELVVNTFASQIFLLTHNFELFRQWLIQLETAKVHVVGGFTVHELRMRYRSDGTGQMRRWPQFDPWTDNKKMSRRLRSLYHYLFAQVANAVIEATPELSLAERMDLLALAPNAARKLMESFLSFRFPEHIGDFHNGMRAATSNVADQSVRTHVERYLHAYSHNEEGDISSSIDPSEATVVLRALFAMMKEVDSKHISAMCNALLIDETQLLAVPAGSTATVSESPAPSP